MILAPFYGIIWLIKSKQTMIQFKPTINGKIVFGLMIFVLVFLVFSSAQAATGVNQTLYYQGKLLDASGDPVTDGSYNMRFVIYSAATGGTCQWSAKGTGANGCVAPAASALSVTVTDGLFTVLLGDITVSGGSQNAIPNTIFNDDTRYLEIQIQYGGGSYETLTPRKALAASAYSFNSRYLEGVEADQFLRSDTDTNFTSGTLTFNDGTILAVDGNIQLTSSTATAGIIYSSGDTLLHTYGGFNFFAGENAGNLTLSGVANTGVGASALNSLTSGGGNSAVGYNALFANTTGGNNVAVGTAALAANTTGGSNTGVGYSVLSSNTTGDDNTAMGRDSLSSNTTGYLNSAYGRYSLAANTTGHENVALGGAALQINTTGSNNTAVGAWTMQFNTAGGNNVAVGKGALNANTTASSNTAVGDSALQSNTTADGNTAVGASALAYNTTGGANVAVGQAALVSNTTGGGNTSVGTQTLMYNTTGASNTALGRVALSQNTTGSSNIGIGDAALWHNLEGSNNIAIGGGALFANTTVSNLTAIGAGALGANTTGSANLGIGYLALNNNTTGGSNVAIGQAALQSNTTASSNTAVGINALNANTTGGANNAFGEGTLRSNTVGNYNVAIGSSTLQNNTTASNNVAVGTTALFSNTTGGSNSAFGSEALYSNTTGTLNVAVGNNALRENTTASGSVAIGVAALQANTTGGPNVAVGTLALTSNTTGGSNVAIGQAALQSNTTASSNTAVGANALNANTTGGANNALGEGTLRSNTTGDNNVAIGNSALYANTTASNNVAIGYLSLYTNTTGENNVAIGRNALAENTTASSNVAVGFNALAANTTGASNIAMGNLALHDNTIGNYNVALGVGALAANITSGGNVAVGYNALNSNTTVAGLTAVGYNALVANTTGIGNNAFGSASLEANTTGDGNVAMGYQALQANTTGGSNTAVGHKALQANTIGMNNTAVGYQALIVNTTGAGNAAFGIGALYSNTTGEANSAFGFQALLSNTTGLNNTALGYSAGDIITTGSNNTFIGNNADASAVDLTNATAIGYNASVGASNSLVLGGTGADAVNVGIGTTTPGSRLEVVQTLAPTDDDSLALVDISGIVNPGADEDTGAMISGNNVVMEYTGAGDIGGLAGFGASIQNNGSGNMTYLVGLLGTAYVNADATGLTTNAIGALVQVGNVGAGDITNAYGISVVTHSPEGAGSIDNYYGLHIQDTTGAGTNSWAIYSDGGDSYFGGNVGIGTTAPDYTLELNATSGNTTFALSDPDVNQPITVLARADTYLALGAISGASYGGGAMVGMTDDDGGSALAALALVGAHGVTDPSDSSPAVFIQALKSDGDTSYQAVGASEEVLQIKNSTTNLITVLGDGKMGIGTTTPMTGLTVVGEDSYLDSSILGFYYGDSNMAPQIGTIKARGTQAAPAAVDNNDSLGMFVFGGYLDETTVSGSSFIMSQATEEWDPSQAGSRLDFITTANGTIFDPLDYTPAMTIDQNGNVGIGASSPQAKLHLVSETIAPAIRLQGDGGMGNESWGEIAMYQGGSLKGRTYWAGNSGWPNYTIDTQGAAAALTISGQHGYVGIGADSASRFDVVFDMTAPVFTGVAVDDMTIRGGYTGASNLSYQVEIDAAAGQDTFKWSDDGGSTWDETGVEIQAGYWQDLNNGVQVRFDFSTGHTLADNWAWDVVMHPLIVNNANVGIGTASPQANLEVSSASGFDSNVFLSDGDVAHGMTLISPTDVYGGFQSYNPTKGGLALGGISDDNGVAGSATPALALMGNIGSNDPTDTTPAVIIIGSKKDVVGTYVQALAATETVLQVNNYDTPLLTILGSGAVGIGDVDPANGGLVVANGVTIGTDSTDNLIDDASNGAGTTTLYVGNETIDTTNPSDVRVKQDIVSTVLTLDDLMQLQIKDFRFRPEFTSDDSLQHGLIAQEVESIYPYAISTRSDGYKMIDYRSFIPLIIKSIQDQQ
ncbi:MAG: tail fiber domain-containing protein, partial [Patescibacteria group bacterium]